jgi:Na+/H+ antiporter NhaA
VTESAFKGAASVAAGLAYADSPDLLDQAKLGVLLGSLGAGMVGYLFLRRLHFDGVGRAP